MFTLVEAAEKFSAMLVSVTKILKSRIPKDEAFEHINNFRSGLSPTAVKSIHISNDFINYILTNADTINFSGVRVYMAKYKKGVGDIGDDRDGEFTVILAPTVAGIAPNSVDVGEYFDYGEPCPPECDGDEGIR